MDQFRHIYIICVYRKRTKIGYRQWVSCDDGILWFSDWNVTDERVYEIYFDDF